MGIFKNSPNPLRRGYDNSGTYMGNNRWDQRTGNYSPTNYGSDPTFAQVIRIVFLIIFLSIGIAIVLSGGK